MHFIVLNRYPGAYATISWVLGHKSLQTAISNYAGEDQVVPQGGETLRTERTINDTRDFGIGRRIENLAELRK